jgi:DNA-binding Lrp family transcriptional regulator
MENNNDNYTIVNVKFENHKAPENKIVKGKEYVLWGEDNLYPQYLIELTQRCGKHNALISGKSQMIAGKEVLSDNELSKAFIEHPNKYDTLHELTYKLAYDMELFGGFACQVIWSVDRKKIASVTHLDISKIRISTDKELYYWCDDWADHKKVRAKEFKTYKRYNPKEPGGTQVMYFKQYRPALKYYPEPEYIGGIPAIETDVEVSNFHLNNIKTGFSAGMMVNFNNGAVPTQEKQREIVQKFKKKFQGTDNAGGVIINFSENRDRSPEVFPLQPPDLDKQFIQLREDTTQEIFVSHKITSPLLFGIKTEGQLGGRNELVEAAELFQNNYISYRQRVFEQMYREVLTINGVQDDTIKIVPVGVIGEAFTSDQQLSVMSTDEQREAMGLPPLEKIQGNEQRKVIDALTAMSPLVANKVLDSMTPEEIRALVSLGPLADKPTPKVDQAMDASYTALEVKLVNLIAKDGLFSAEQLALLTKNTLEDVTITMKRLQERGIIMMVTNGNTGELLSELTEQGYKVAERFPLAFSEGSHTFNDDELFTIFESFGTTNDTFELFKDSFAYTPDDKDKKILDYIKGDKKVTPEVIAEGIKMDVSDVAERLATMEDNGILASEVVTNQGEDIVTREITPQGVKVLEDEGLKIKAIETFYGYKTRPDVPKPITKSREFCVKMMDLTDTNKGSFKLFSRKDIDRLSSALGYNVWEQRGGYYHNPKTDITTPYCRHQWSGVKIVRK